MIHSPSISHSVGAQESRSVEALGTLGKIAKFGGCPRIAVDLRNHKMGPQEPSFREHSSILSDQHYPKLSKTFSECTLTSTILRLFWQQPILGQPCHKQVTKGLQMSSLPYASLFPSSAAHNHIRHDTNVAKQYDELPNALVVTPIVNNKGLTYTNWDYASTQAVQVGGVASKTPPNRIVSRASGELAFSPQDPFFQFFSPQSFFFGCAARTAQAAATLATACDITVRGFDAKGRKVAEQSFSFKPPLSPVAPVPMVSAKFSSAFNQKLKKVTVEYPTQTLSVLLIDNYAFRLYK
ncbi:MAG: hypothetical protein Q9174_004476 [Haloplaca sp. 1 TL-2023]